MTYSEDYLKAAHKHAIGHRADMEASTICGCFYCRQTYEPSEIENWIEDPGGTAICPRCGIDSVLGDVSGLPVRDPVFLTDMHVVWFERTVSFKEVQRQYDLAHPKPAERGLLGWFSSKGRPRA